MAFIYHSSKDAEQRAARVAENTGRWVQAPFKGLLYYQKLREPVSSLGVEPLNFTVKTDSATGTGLGLEKKMITPSSKRPTTENARHPAPDETTIPCHQPTLSSLFVGLSPGAKLQC